MHVTALLLAFLLGIVAGLRTFTAPAVLWIMRHGGAWAYVLGAAALFEYAVDLHPKGPNRTALPGLVARFASGAFVGWWIAVSSADIAVVGALAGGLGAMIGAYAGLAARMRAIVLIGNVPAGLCEDVVAIAAAVALVNRLGSL
jgi:uncharacterized membrane protein